jgi:hypothetical protein
MERAALYGQSRNCQGSGLKGHEVQEPEENLDANGAGMSLKINEMRKCHPHQGFWRRGEVGDFTSRDAGKANPRGLSHAVAIRYRDSGPSEPKPVILRGIYLLQLKSGCFSVNLNANRPSDQGFGPWNPSTLPPIPRLNRLAKSHGPKVRRSGETRVARKARAGMPVQQPGTSRLPLEVKSDTSFTIPSHHVIESSTLKNDPPQESLMLLKTR